MIALVDYGAGNLTSVRKAFAAVGADIATPAMPDDLRAARAIVVPGVGHFGATAVLDEPWREGIRAAVARRVPLLGICLGLQWLFEGSEEAPELTGLAVLEGRCRLLRPERGVGGLPVHAAMPEAAHLAAEPAVGDRAGEDMCPAPAGQLDSLASSPGSRAARPRLKVPHVGWNGLECVRPSRLLAGVPNGAQAYFTHSYVAPLTEACVATTTHGERFASVVERGHVFGAQFHPEKSGEVGLRMLRNFLEAVEQSG